MVTSDVAGANRAAIGAPVTGETSDRSVLDPSICRRLRARLTEPPPPPDRHGHRSRRSTARRPGREAPPSAAHAATACLAGHPNAGLMSRRPSRPVIDGRRPTPGRIGGRQVDRSGWRRLWWAGMQGTIARRAADADLLHAPATGTAVQPGLAGSPAPNQQMYQSRVG